MTGGLLIYGAYGYTGALCAEEAVRRGIRPILAGRDRDRVRSLAERLALEWRAFDLSDPTAVAAGVDGTTVVLHCAGPFSRTATQMVGACLEASVHYLDVTGEIEVFEAVHGFDENARSKRVMLMPGVGFDVVPSDCLAAHVAVRLPTARRLELAFSGIGSTASRGTATTTVENLGRGGMIRREGVLTPVPTAWRTRKIDLGVGPTTTVTIPWGDVYTAYLTTGIPDIRVYMAVPAAALPLLYATRVLGPVLRSASFQRLARRLIDSRSAGPDAEQRQRGASLLWAEASDAAGERVVSRLRTPEGYSLTVDAALTIVARVLAGQVTPGFQTPAGCYGPDLVLSLEGCSREDVDL